MDKIIYYICIPLGYLMKLSWRLVGNYGLAIILFTFITKIVLLPVSVWIQKNSIQMVKLQPDINFLKARLYGNPDAIADEQGKLFKKEHYHPMLSLVPLAIQLILLMGVVYIIYHPLDYLFGFSDAAASLAQFIGVSTEDSSFQLRIIDCIQNGSLTASSEIAGIAPAYLSEIVGAVRGFDLSFCGLNLCHVTSEVWGIYILVPVIAGFSSWLLCFTQNLSNVIQHEQGKLNQISLTVISVGISLYLGCFVPAGIALYWVASNVFSIIQMYILNAAINPKKYVDYDALEKSRKALADIEALDDKTDADFKKNKQREKADVKRLTHIANKHLVIYSEKSGFYKYFKDIIAELLKRSNLTVHYITNDPNDVIFEVAKEQPRIRPYYVGLKKTVSVMMMLDCDAVLMTTPDLDKYYIKRSYIRKDAEYIYVPHDMMSVTMSFREGAFDAFDTVFCAGPHIESELRATEKVYGLKEKNLVRFGYPLSDLLVKAGEAEKEKPRDSGIKEILIAPSWQEDNLLDSCIDKLITGLYGDGHHITVRPHPEYVKRYPAALQAIVDRYADTVGDKLTFELDFSSNSSIYSSDILITDWSGIAAEFCFATKRPAVFVNTKMKCENPNWQKIGITPVEISLRDEIGVSVDKDKLDGIGDIVNELLASPEKYEKAISERFDTLLFNHGNAAEAGAKYILESLSKRKTKK